MSDQQRAIIQQRRENVETYSALIMEKGYTKQEANIFISKWLSDTSDIPIDLQHARVMDNISNFFK